MASTSYECRRRMHNEYTKELNNSNTLPINVDFIFPRLDIINPEKGAKTKKQPKMEAECLK